MKMILQCKCGARLRASKSDAGKRAKCKKCERVFTIPESAPAEVIEATPVAASKVDPTEARAEMKSCESCGRGMAQGAIVCIHCGYHATLGRRLETVDTEKAEIAETQFTWGSYAMAALFAGGTYFPQIGMDGPTYLLFYFSLFCIVGLLVPVLRKTVVDSNLVNHSAILMVLATGAVRVALSVSDGRYKVLFLVIGMIGAAFVFWGTRTSDGDKDPFTNKAGGLALSSYFVVYTLMAGAIALIYFYAPVSKIVVSMGAPAAFIFVAATGFMWGVASGKSRSWSSGSNQGNHLFGCSSCGGGCGGGGCGGGCGGCGG